MRPHNIKMRTFSLSNRQKPNFKPDTFQFRSKFYLISIGLIIGSVLLFNDCKKEKGTLKPVRYIGNYNKDFNDLNDLHLKAAQTIGISPISSREEAEKQSKKLKEIKSCNTFDVMELTHSIPFLAPQAADLLDKIGNNFRDSLESLNAPVYRLRVTSILRTKDDISKLKKRNVNSTENSAHLYGTTFDIAWNKYNKADEKDTLNLTPEQLKMVLASVLRDLKKEKTCYIKHEKKQGCFHITARKGEDT